MHSSSNDVLKTHPQLAVGTSSPNRRVDRGLLFRRHQRQYERDAAATHVYSVGVSEKRLSAGRRSERLRRPFDDDHANAGAREQRTDRAESGVFSLFDDA